MSNQQVAYWLSLHAACGGTAAAGELLRKQPNISELFSDGPDAAEADGRISAALAAQVRRALRAMPRVEEILETCRREGWHVITPGSACWPLGFRTLKDPPLALFAAGDPAILRAEKTAAVVGTRKPSPQSEIAAYRLGEAFSSHGIVTVSGGALGIDSAAHEGAMHGPGATIAMLGNGLGHGYLAEKAVMRKRIQDRGLLLTELFPYRAPSAATFPLRNRLIAALGQTLTVVQSAEKGGSMISAKYAAAFGCKMFALSGRVFYSPGCELLIARGAAPLADAGEVLAFYGIKRVSVPLENDGTGVPPILHPRQITPEEFASLNGVSEAEARAFYDRLFPAGRPSPKPQTVKDPAPAPAPLSPLQTAAEKERIAREKGLSEELRAVFFALEESPVGLDDLAALTALSPSQVMTAVTLLELEGLAQTLPGDRTQLMINSLNFFKK